MLIDAAVAAIRLAHEYHNPTIQRRPRFGRVHAQHPGFMFVEHVPRIYAEVATRRREVQEKHTAESDRVEYPGAFTRERSIMADEISTPVTA